MSSVDLLCMRRLVREIMDDHQLLLCVAASHKSKQGARVCTPHGTLAGHDL